MFVVFNITNEELQVTIACAQIQMLQKCAQVTIELHIILNLFLQQLVSDGIRTWKTYFRVSGPGYKCSRPDVA
jgi:hypothetical protein